MCSCADDAGTVVLMECEQELKCLFSQVIRATEHAISSLPTSQKPTMRTVFDARLSLNLE
jgi:hypothetical protein